MALSSSETKQLTKPSTIAPSRLAALVIRESDEL